MGNDKGARIVMPAIMVRDRFIRGLLAGIVGGFAALAVNLFFNEVLNFGKLHFYEISGVMIFGHLPRGLIQSIFAEIGHIGLSAAVGIALAYLLPKIKTDYLWIKGIFAGLAVWFAVYASTVLFKVPVVHKTDLPSALTNFLASIIYGLVTVIVLRKFDHVHLGTDPFGPK